MPYIYGLGVIAGIAIGYYMGVNVCFVNLYAYFVVGTGRTQKSSIALAREILKGAYRRKMKEESHD